MNHHYSHLHQAQVKNKLDSLITTVLAISSNIDLQTIHIHHQSIKRRIHWFHKRHHFFVAISWATNVTPCLLASLGNSNLSQSNSHGHWGMNDLLVINF